MNGSGAHNKISEMQICEDNRQENSKLNNVGHATPARSDSKLSSIATANLITNEHAENEAVESGNNLAQQSGLAQVMSYRYVTTNMQQDYSI